MNLALSVFSLLLLVNLELFPATPQVALFCFLFAVAHGSQFYFNVPVALAGRRHGEAVWPVLTGPMRFIFIGDLTLLLLNAVVCGSALLSK